MDLKIGSKLHGFTLRERVELPEIKAVMYRMEYEKNGADLIWLDRADDNKTFAIGFKTTPEDHTGIFHIIEHSVLNGSEKYPVKEPFVELLKSSLQTFLNAMTGSDFTTYPVASRNPQDFLNLMDVYLDAVFHPLTLRDPHAFRQEGWHYELDSPEGELEYNGVVYNEMKGAYSNPEELLVEAMNRALFPDNCYRFSSGGDPDHIPELTYEQYVASHKRFYHPSNARIFLDGEVDLDASLEKIAGFLEPYDRITPDADIPLQAPVAPAETREEYQIGPDEDGSDKVLLGKGWVVGTFDQRAKITGMDILAEVLCDSNESPVKKALVGGGLAQDVEMEMMSGMLQPYLFLSVKNTSLDKEAQVWAVLEETLRQAAQGLDHDQLRAALNRAEFAAKERSFGGLGYGMRAMSAWLYGGHPADGLRNEELFAQLRAGVDQGYFEALLQEVLLESRHLGQVCMVPSNTLGARRAQALKEQLAALKASWTPEQVDQVIAEFKTLRARQERPDTPEELASIPLLTLSDIPAENKPLKNTVEQVDGLTVLHQDVETDGIAYLDLHFALDDLDPEELGLVTLAGSVLGEMATERSSALELKERLDATIGRFSVYTAVYGDRTVKPVLTVSAALLESRKAEAAQIIREILLETRFDDRENFFNLLRQFRIVLEQRTGSSRNAANIHAASVLSARSAVEETLHGITYLRTLQKLEKGFAENGEALCERLAALLKKVFVRARLTASITGPMDEAWVRSVTQTLPEGEMGPAAVYAPAENFDQGFSIPAGVGYSASCGNLRTVGAEFTGCQCVAATLLRYDYLWNEVRVKGGAYGTAMLVAEDGEVQFSSYRDPRCAQSLATFDAAGAALRHFCQSGEAPDKYIISTIGDLEKIVMPRNEAVRAAGMYFGGRTQEDLQTLRTQVLSTTVEQLEAFSRQLDALTERSNVCVIGGEAILQACGERLSSIESLQQ